MNPVKKKELVRFFDCEAIAGCPVWKDEKLTSTGQDSSMSKSLLLSLFVFVIGSFVYWFFADTLGIKALYVAWTWQPIVFLMKYLFNKKWVFA